MKRKVQGSLHESFNDTVCSFEGSCCYFKVLQTVERFRYDVVSKYGDLLVGLQRCFLQEITPCGQVYCGGLVYACCAKEMA